METRITGTTMPVLEIGLEPGETIVAEPGELSCSRRIWRNTSGRRRP